MLQISKQQPLKNFVYTLLLCRYILLYFRNNFRNGEHRRAFKLKKKEIEEYRFLTSATTIAGRIKEELL